MCGRFVLATPKKISERFSVAGKAPLLQENYNVAPSTKVPVIIQNSPNQAVFMDWGFKWKNNQQGIINIRGESFSEKPFFRNFLSKNRCLVPANGFYEWGFIALENGKKDKYPFYFSLKNSDLFAFAGIYNDKSVNNPSANKKENIADHTTFIGKN